MPATPPLRRSATPLLRLFASSRLRFALPLAALALAAIVGGCAQVPPEAHALAIQRQLIVTFDMAGSVNPEYYYFIAIDTNGDPASGPVPVVSAPWGNGWVTGSVTHFVEYHQGVYQVYKFRPGTNLLQFDPLGTPFQYNRPEGTSRIQVVLDMDTLGTNLNRINLNLITTDRINIEPNFLGTKLYDGLGLSGNSYINIPVTVNQTFSNAQSLDPEHAGDVPPQPAGGVDVSQIDIVNWSVEVRVTQ